MHLELGSADLYIFFLAHCFLFCWVNMFIWCCFSSLCFFFFSFCTPVNMWVLIGMFLDHSPTNYKHPWGLCTWNQWRTGIFPVTQFLSGVAYILINLIAYISSFFYVIAPGIHSEFGTVLHFFLQGKFPYEINKAPFDNKVNDG